MCYTKKQMEGGSMPKKAQFSADIVINKAFDFAVVHGAEFDISTPYCSRTGQHQHHRFIVRFLRLTI